MGALHIRTASVLVAVALFSGSASAADGQPFVSSVCAEAIDHKFNADGRDVGQRRFRVTIDWNGFTPAPGLIPDLVAYDASNVYYPQFRDDRLTSMESTVRFKEHGSLYPLTFAIATFTREAQAELNRSCFYPKRGEEKRCFVKADTLGVTVYKQTISISRPTEELLCSDVRAEIPGKLALPKILYAIGNTEYNSENDQAGATRGGDFKRLPNAASDARDVYAKFTRLMAPNGGERSIVNPDNAGMDDMTRSFGAYSKELANSAAGVKSVFFFSGHGFSFKNETYLVPLGAKLPSVEQLKSMPEPDVWLDKHFWRLSQIVRYLRPVREGFNLVILDICRDNPWAQQFPQDIEADTTGYLKDSKGDVIIGNGSNQVALPKNTIIAFATAPGTPARDDIFQSRHSPYVEKLLLSLESGRNIEDVINFVEADPAWETTVLQHPTHVGRIEPGNGSACLGPCNSTPHAAEIR